MFGKQTLGFVSLVSCIAVSGAFSTGCGLANELQDEMFGDEEEETSEAEGDEDRASNDADDADDRERPEDLDDLRSDPDDARDLETCATAFIPEAAVPDFFKTYFRCVAVAMRDTVFAIITENLPPHQSWYYADTAANYVEFEEQGAQYWKAPNEIETQNITVKIPLNPTARDLTINAALVDGEIGTSQYEYPMGAVGVALDSVVLFNPLAAPGHDIEDEKYTFDLYNGHPQDRGVYHYHTDTKGPLEVLELIGATTTSTPGSGEIELYGMMCDGTVILGCTELDGATPDSDGFDSQNGHVHDIADEDGTVHFENRYHTHLCPGTFTQHKFTPEIQYYDTCDVSDR